MDRGKGEESYPLIEEEGRPTRHGLLLPEDLGHHSDSEGGGAGCPIYFGVRSYLHHFYDRSPSSDNQAAFCEDCGDVEDRAKRDARFGQRFFCKAVIWIAINIIIIGIISLLVGYLIPKRSIIIGYKDHLEIIDRSALNYNKLLETCRLVGLILFCIGSFLLFIALIIISLIPSRNIDDVASVAICRLQNVSPFETEEKIPVTERITSIQPVWDEPNVSY